MLISAGLDEGCEDQITNGTVQNTQRKLANGVREEIEPRHGNTGGKSVYPDNKENDTCIIANWTTFLSWNIRTDGDDAECSAADFGDGNDRPRSSSKPLTITKIRDPFRDTLRSNMGISVAPRFELQINSPFLQSQLKKVANIQSYPDIILKSSQIVLTGAFSPLYHYIEEMRKYTVEGTTATEKDRQDMEALYYLVTKGPQSARYEDAKKRISEGLVMYDEMWALFKPGDYVVTRDLLGHCDIVMVKSVSVESDSSDSDPITHKSNMWWVLTMLKYTWGFDHFRKTTFTRRIDDFFGSKKITDLNLYPLAYDTSRSTIVAKAIDRGKLWKMYHERDPTTMSYQGLALPLIAEAFPRYPPDPMFELTQSELKVLNVRFYCTLLYSIYTLSSD